MAKRFASHSPDEIMVKRANVVPSNTAKANRKAARTLRQYLEEKNQETDFESFSKQQLGEVLSHFYLDARKTNGELYSANTLENFRHSINRYLNAPPHDKNIDVIKDVDFRDANMSFKTAMAELKSAGKGVVEHYPLIEDADLRKLYGSIHLNPDTPNGLFNKVQMDIRLYFCRRGGENMVEMKRDTFSVITDPNSGSKFVKKTADELTKNHRENDRESYGGRMPEQPSSPLCPVRTFEKYISKLHPELDRLWQRSLDSFLSDSPVWYSKRPIGKDKLSSFMTDLSAACSLSKRYTNHSIRVTGTTILARKFSPAQVMSVTGHKAVSSLAIYHRVSDSEKMDMGQTISGIIMPPSTIPALPPTETVTPADMPGALALPTTEASDVIQEPQLQGFDIEQLFTAFDSNEQVARRDQRTTQCTTITSRQAAPMFYGCTIGKIEVIVQK